jgi:hypothetical protein
VLQAPQKMAGPVQQCEFHTEPGLSIATRFAGVPVGSKTAALAGMQQPLSVETKGLARAFSAGAVALEQRKPHGLARPSE